MKNNKKQYKKRKKIRTLVLLLFLTIIMFGTSTYAWFTANRIVNIESIDVHVETSDGLQISTDGKTWKSVVTKTDILEHAYTNALNYIPESLDAVSTSGTVSSNAEGKTRRLNFFSSNIGSSVNDNGGAYTIYTQAVNEVNDRKFVAFDLFIKVSSDKDIYLNSSDDNYSNVVKRANTENKNYEDRGLKNAARVAFVPVGEADANASQDDITKAYYTSNAPAAKIWEPNNDTHSQAVINSVGPEYGFTGDNALVSPGDRVEYFGMKAIIPQTKKVDLIKTVRGIITSYDNSGTPVAFSEAVSQGNVTNTSSVYSTDGVLLSTPSTLATGVSYKFINVKRGITKVRVYMWIEGQDIDCENNASGTDITYNIELSIRENSVVNP